MLALARRSRSAAGTALVEAAVSLPIFLALVFAIFELGLYMFTWTSLAHAVNVGARLAAIHEADQTVVVNSMKSAASPALTLQTGDIAMQVNGGGTPFASRSHGHTLVVSASVLYTPLFNVVFDIATPLTVSSRAEILVE